MSTTQEVREFFRSHPNEKFDNATIREKLGIDDSQSCAVALNLMHNNGEIKRQEKATGKGFEYWMGAGTAAAPLTPRQVAERVTKTRGPKQSRVAKTPAPAKEKKRKYTRRPPPPHAPSASAQPAHGSAMFAIRHDGQLGIDNDGHAIALPKPEVQRLQEFLKTVSPLWS